MKLKSIKQSVIIKADPHAVFQSLIDSKKHSAFTGSKAVISRKAGGKFTAYDGSLSGKNVKVIVDKLIVQDWKSDEENWPVNHYSRAQFRLTGVKEGTRLDFLQTGVPDLCVKDISDGWIQYYWEPLKAYLEKSH